MAQTGYTPILLYSSSTGGNTPSAGNLTNSTLGSELAINIADKNLFFKDSSNVVNTVPIRQSSGSSNGWLSSTDWTTFNNKQPAGTYVTSVSGTAPVVSSGGTTPTISMAAATSSVNGYLTSTDWSTFNGKQAALVSGTNIKTVNSTSLLGSGDVSVGVLTVTGTAPVVSSGGANPAISMAVANGTTNGYLSSTDWTTFNNKQAALVSGTNIKTVSGASLLGSGDVGTIGTGYGGTGLTSFTSGGVVYASSTSVLATGAGLQFDGTNLGISVTPNAWLSSQKALQVWGASIFSNGYGNANYGMNYYVNSSSQAIYLSNNAALYFAQDYLGNQIWGSAPAGTAGNVATFTERMRLDVNGRLLLNTTGILYSNDVTLTSLAKSTTTGAISAVNPASTTSVIYTSQSVTAAGTGWYHFVGQSGNGTTITNNNILIFGNGNVQNANNSYGAFSDIKLKENIIDTPNKLDDLCKVKIRNYNLIGEELKQIGVIAQELESVFPNLVEEIADRDLEGNILDTTTKSVKYSVFIPILIKAVQELKAELDLLKG